MRITRCTGIIVGIALLSGCYTYEPTGAATPEIGQEFAFDINDVGRVGLGGSMGPEIAQIEGRLISRENAEYLVAVTNVHFLRGGEHGRFPDRAFVAFSVARKSNDVVGSALNVPRERHPHAHWNAMS